MATAGLDTGPDDADRCSQPLVKQTSVRHSTTEHRDAAILNFLSKCGRGGSRDQRSYQREEESWEYIGSKTCGKPCHLPSSAGNTVTMELATVNDENPCGDRGLDAVCPPVALDGTDGEKWRRRESNPRPAIPQKRPLRAYSVD